MRLLLILLYSLNVFSSELPQFSSREIPTEFKLMYEKLLKSDLSKEQKERVVPKIYRINEYFSKIQGPYFNLLLKGEIYRTILQYKFDEYFQPTDVNSFFISKTLNKLQKLDQQYSGYSKWIINSAIGDLVEYANEGTLDQMNSLTGNDLKTIQKVGPIKRKLKYLAPWFYFIDKYSPTQFERLVLQLVLSQLNSLQQIGYIFSKNTINENKSIDLFIIDKEYNKNVSFDLTKINDFKESIVLPKEQPEIIIPDVLEKIKLQKSKSEVIDEIIEK